LLSVFLFSIIATAELARNKSNLAVAAIYNRIAYDWCVVLSVHFQNTLILLALISVFLFSVIATVGLARNFAVHC
jgi:hypothetical protein